ncbi:hypothetical protein DSO57_1021886 [Entomophthora muscae]|uniref:Uncharacterized protein n=1 Tax=Entomophthora muscae TaxID=34485 RepID=A0ACC2SFX3_9FUNG|nr:hypothetical protein DSO57_1021886 [Entomophthora muscae]
MPCVPVNIHDPDSTLPKKESWKAVPDIKFLMLIKFIQDFGDPKKAAAIIGMEPKKILQAEKPTRLSTLLTKECRWTIWQGVTCDTHLHLIHKAELLPQDSNPKLPQATSLQAQLPVFFELEPGTD